LPSELSSSDGGAYLNSSGNESVPDLGG